MKKTKASKRKRGRLLAAPPLLGGKDIIEDCFESLLHKYNWLRKRFATRRYQKHGAILFYQPERLREACRKYPIDTLMDAIETALSARRDNYFVAFLEALGESRSLGGWQTYGIA